MALGIYFAHNGFTRENTTTPSSSSMPPRRRARRRSYHVALETEGSINVFDIWESQEAFDAFGSTLVPILTGLGIELGAPMVAECTT